MQTLNSARVRAFTGASRAAAPRPCLGLAIKQRAAMQQQRAVSDASLADIADLESRASVEEAGSASGLPVLPSEQVSCAYRQHDARPEIGPWQPCTSGSQSHQREMGASNAAITLGRYTALNGPRLRP